MQKVKAALAAAGKFLAGEPVAVWGVVLGFVLAVAPQVGLSAHTVDSIGAVLALLGVPVVRSRVTPMTVLAAIVKRRVQ